MSNNFNYMEKYIKYATYITMSVVLIASASVVYAQDNTSSSSDSIKAIVQERQDNMAKLKEVREENKIQTQEKKDELVNTVSTLKDDISKAKEARNEIKNERNKDELEKSREEFRNQVKATIEEIKTKREEFRAEVEKNKEAIQKKMEEVRNTFRNSLSIIKDEVKKASTEKIFDNVSSLNTTLVEKYSDRIDQIETVLLSIESRTTKAEDVGIDVATVKSEIEKAKVAIASARESVLKQSEKVYEVSITNETTLKSDMTALRDVFKKDIEVIKEKITQAHTAVSQAATTLSKIPNIDEVSISPTEDDTQTEETSE